MPTTVSVFASARYWICRGDGYAVSGEDPRQLPLTDPDRHRDLYGAEAGLGQVLVYIGACGAAGAQLLGPGTSGY
jgi:hypothetical protein